MTNLIQRGMRVTVTGGPMPFEGPVLGASDAALIVGLGAGGSVLLKRDIASTRPERWRLNGMPVEVAVRQEDFSERLRALEEKTR